MNKLILRRGPFARKPVLQDGELIFLTDKNRLSVQNGENSVEFPNAAEVSSTSGTWTPKLYVDNTQVTASVSGTYLLQGSFVSLTISVSDIDVSSIAAYSGFVNVRSDDEIFTRLSQGLMNCSCVFSSTNLPPNYNVTGCVKENDRLLFPDNHGGGGSSLDSSKLSGFANEGFSIAILGTVDHDTEI